VLLYFLHIVAVNVNSTCYELFRVFTTEVERSLSTLKRVKTLLRNQIGNYRLTGLIHLTVHWEFSVSPKGVLDIMARSKRKFLL